MGAILLDCKKTRNGEVVALFRTLQGGRLMSRCSKVLIPGIAVSAEGLKNDFEDVD